MSRTFRLTALLSHPVQYYAPWFQRVHAAASEIDLTVLYATRPTAEQQGVGFDCPFEWDVPLLDGYRSRILREPSTKTDVSANRFWGADVPEVGAAILDTKPDAVLVMGWHSSTYFRAIHACRRHNVPLLVRGDTNLLSAPRGWKRPIWMARTRWLLRQFDACLSVGLRTGAMFRFFGIPDSRIFETPHAIDNERFGHAVRLRQGAERHAIRRRLGIGESSFVVLFSGKLEEKKHPADVIRAAASMNPRPEVLVAGSGPLEPECRALAEREGVRLVSLGFVNQSEMPSVYAAADCLALPSDARETWGLVVNEALAAGLPCVVGSEAGCAPDLVTPSTGSVVPTGDVGALSGALAAVRDRVASGHPYAPDCQALVAGYSLERATEGLRSACRFIADRGRSVRPEPRPTRVLACCGSMVFVGGLERMTFEVLGVLRRRDSAVHCVVNSWSNQEIVPLADRIGASWSTGFYLYRFARRSVNPLDWLRVFYDCARTSTGLLRDAARFRPTHVFFSDFLSVVRNAPALMVLRLFGCQVVMRLGNAPDQGTFYRWLWKLGVDPFVDRFICNSAFTGRALAAHGVPDDKRIVVSHVPPTRRASAAIRCAERDWRRLIYVGQVIPEKGLDLLLDAVGLLVARGHDVRLDVVGEMNGWAPPEYERYRESIRARAAAADLQGRVRFLGYREDVPELLAEAAVHCMPSRRVIREGFGIVVIEAKQAGVPSVVLPSGALPELIVQGEDGWVCDEETTESLARGIEYVLAADRLQPAMDAARRSASKFSRQRFEQAWSSIFSDAA
jgi:glycosyltransferase involved in cell wall biosynthesis